MCRVCMSRHDMAGKYSTGQDMMDEYLSERADLIFVTNYIRGEKNGLWRNISFPCMTIVGNLNLFPHVEKFQMSPHDRCAEI